MIRRRARMLARQKEREDFIAGLAEKFSMPIILVRYAWEEHHSYGFEAVEDAAEELASVYEKAKEEEAQK